MADAAMIGTTDKRVCLLTGASGRLGTAFCRGYHARYDIAAVYCDNPLQVPTQSQRFVDPLRPGEPVHANEDPVFAIRADLLDDDGLERVVDQALARFGGIDLLVNAAAISVWAPIVGSDAMLGNLADMLELNAVVPVKLAAAVAARCWRDSPEENRAANRNVVNVSSAAGIYVYPGTGQSGYAASKAALNMVSCHLADEFARFKVRANVVAPNSFPALVSTESVADAIARLDAGDLTGKILVLDNDGETLL
jgi:NAD(P)-dependent dehydrogenase (short-subunit alcohol dehydrogenase family)